MRARLPALCATPIVAPCSWAEVRFDSRPNNGARVRPILYLVYTRTWFFDEQNHTKRRSLNMPMTTYDSLPQHTHSLLLRAFRHEITRR